MLSRTLYWRPFLKDRIFLSLFGLSIVTFIVALLLRRPSLETNSLPFSLGVLFFAVNIAFGLLSLRREPLLSYMFLTAAILNNGILLFFFQYLLSIQGK